MFFYQAPLVKGGCHGFAVMGGFLPPPFTEVISLPRGEGGFAACGEDGRGITGNPEGL